MNIRFDKLTLTNHLHRGQIIYHVSERVRYVFANVRASNYTLINLETGQRLRDAYPTNLHRYQDNLHNKFCPCHPDVEIVFDSTILLHRDMRFYLFGRSSLGEILDRWIFNPVVSLDGTTMLAKITHEEAMANRFSELTNEPRRRDGGRASEYEKSVGNR